MFAIERRYCEELSSASYLYLNYSLGACVALASYKLSQERNRELDCLIAFVAVAALTTHFIKRFSCPKVSIEEQMCCLDNRYTFDIMKFQLTALVVEGLHTLIRFSKAPKKRDADERVADLLEGMGMSIKDRDREFQQFISLTVRVVIISLIISGSMSMN